MMRSLLIALLALLVVGVPAQAASLSSTGSFLASSLDANGCARESGAVASVNLTSWAALGLVASGRSASSAASCIERHSKALTSTTDIELAVLALTAACVSAGKHGKACIATGDPARLNFARGAAATAAAERRALPPLSSGICIQLLPVALSLPAPRPQVHQRAL